MAQGHLHVTIVEAAKLADKDKTDFNDPYVEVYLDDKKKQKTGTINNVERPVWNETFDLYVTLFFFPFYYLFKFYFFLFSEVWSSGDHLHIDVYDEDEGKKPDLIGSAKLSLEDVMKNGRFDDWVKLPGLLGFGSRGDVHIRMTFDKANNA